MLRFMRRHDEVFQNHHIEYAEWLGLRAAGLAALRDFEAADKNINQAFEIAPDQRWLAVQHAGILEFEDRYEQGLEVIQACLEQHPWYRPAVQSAAHLLELNGHTDQAIDLLERASKIIECGAIHIQLAGLLRNRQQVEAAQKHYEQAATLYPLLDQTTSDAWLNHNRSDIACQLGNYTQGLELLRRIDKRHKGHFHEQVQARLEQNSGAGTRQQLDLPFVRQHHMTCAPATLTMIARYWGKKAEHLQIAEAICYDGTPYHAERQWAQEQGYQVQEFTVTPDATRKLIDRGVPFTLSTVEPTSAHLQAVIGYDTARGVLLLRDPFHPSISEVLDSALADRYGPFGPRGMLLVPADRTELLDGLKLPDVQQWELTHQMRGKLVAHQREQALRPLRELETHWPDHILTLSARLSLANYDGDLATRAEQVQAILGLYPESSAIAFQMFHCLQEQGRQQEAVSLLNTWRQKKNSDPVFLEEYARLLTQDDRYNTQANALLRRAIRARGQVAENYYNLANLIWAQRDYTQATELYRYAACLEDRKESYVLAYFRAQRLVGNEEDTLTMLQHRAKRLEKKSSRPAQTLFEAYRLLGRSHDGLTMLEQALSARPTDGDLMLFIANELGTAGRRDDAQAMLERARGSTHNTAWLRAAAFLAEDNGQNQDALNYWQRVAEQNPLDVTAQNKVANLKTRVIGPDAGPQHLKSCVEHFPHHIGLLYALYQMVREQNTQEGDQVLRQIIDAHPHHAWALRELAFNLLDRPDGLDEAIHFADLAYAIDPHAPEVLSLRGQIARTQDRPEDAAQAFREAIERSPDTEFAINHLIDLATTPEAQRRAVDFVYQQILNQHTDGIGIERYAVAARRVYKDHQIEAQLRTLLEQRESLWAIWATLIDHLLHAERLSQARTVAQEATERFPLIPQLWNRLAEIERVSMDRDAQVKCLEQAIAVCPDNRFATRELANAYEHTDRIDQAASLLRQASTRDPHDTATCSQLAQIYWTLGRQDQAFDLVARSTECSPYHDHLWQLLYKFGEVLQREQEVEHRLRQVVVQRPGEAHAWMTLAYHLTSNDSMADRLEAINECLAIAPRLYEAHDFKARLLCEAQRYDDAIRACTPEALAGDTPHNFRGRMAWVYAQRGDIQKAIDMMWDLIRNHNDYTWGLEQLCIWCDEIGDTPGQIQAAELLVQLDPHSPLALNYRARAAIAAVERDDIPHNQQKQRLIQAKQDFEHVTQLDPTNNYSTLNLIDLHLKDNEPEAASAVLQRAQPYLPDDERFSLAAQIEAQRGNKGVYREHLLRLATVRSDRHILFDRAFDAGQQFEIADAVLREAITLEDANPTLAIQLIRPTLHRRQWGKVVRQIRSLHQIPAMWDAASAVFLEHIANEPHQKSCLTRFVKQNRSRLAASDLAWGEAAFALANHGLSRMTYDHFACWQDRQGVKPWVLSNLASILLQDNRLAEVQSLSKHCLQMEADHSYSLHLTNLAYCQAVAGDPAIAHQLLDQTVVAHIPWVAQFEHHLARAAATARNASGPHATRQAWQMVRQARHQFPSFKTARSARTSYRRVVKTIGAQGGLLDTLRVWRHLLNETFD